MHKKRAAPLPPQVASVPKENGSAAAPEIEENGSIKNGAEEVQNEPVDIKLTIILPDTSTKELTVLSNMALMDLRMQLCAKYKLSPSSYTVEPLKSADGDGIPHMPSHTIGDLECSFIKIKGTAKEVPKPVAPKLPEQTVRLTVKLSQSQKSVMRVNPRTPLSELYPQIALKSGFKSNSTLELVHPTDGNTKLDQNKCLDDYKIREILIIDKTATPVKVESNVEHQETTPSESSRSSAHSHDKKHSIKITSLFKRSKKHKENHSAAPPLSVANQNGNNNKSQPTPTKPASPPVQQTDQPPVPATRNKRKAPVAPPRATGQAPPAAQLTEKPHKKTAPKPPSRTSSSETKSSISSAGSEPKTQPKKPPRSKSSDSMKIKEAIEDGSLTAVSLDHDKAENVILEEEVFNVPDDTLQREMAKATEEIDLALEDVPTLAESSDDDDVIYMTGELKRERKEEQQSSHGEETEDKIEESTKQEEPVPQEEVREIVIVDKSDLIIEESLIQNESSTDPVEREYTEEDLPPMPDDVPQIVEDDLPDVIPSSSVEEDILPAVEGSTAVEIASELPQEDTSVKKADGIIVAESHYDPEFGAKPPVDEFDFMATVEQVAPVTNDAVAPVTNDAVAPEPIEDKEIITIPVEEMDLPPPPPDMIEGTKPAPVVKQPEIISAPTQQPIAPVVDEEAEETEREIEKLRLKIQRMKEKKRREEEKKFDMIPEKTSGMKSGSSFTLVPKHREGVVYEDRETAPSIGLNLSPSGELKSFVPEPAIRVEEEKPEQQEEEKHEEIPNDSPPEEPQSTEPPEAEPERIVLDVEETKLAKPEDNKEEKEVTKEATNVPKGGGYVSSAALREPTTPAQTQTAPVQFNAPTRKSTLPSYYKKFLQHKGKTSFVSSAAAKSKTDTNTFEPKPVQNNINKDNKTSQDCDSKPTSPPPVASKPKILPQDDAHKPTSPKSPHPPISPKPVHLKPRSPPVTNSKSIKDLPPPEENAAPEDSTDSSLFIPPPPEVLNSKQDNETAEAIAAQPPRHSFYGATSARPFSSTGFRPMSKSLKAETTMDDYNNNNQLTMGSSD